MEFCIRESYEDDRTKYYYHPTCFNLEVAVKAINELNLGTTIFESVLLSDLDERFTQECFNCEEAIY